MKRLVDLGSSTHFFKGTKNSNSFVSLAVHTVPLFILYLKGNSCIFFQIYSLRHYIHYFFSLISLWNFLDSWLQFWLGICPNTRPHVSHRQFPYAVVSWECKTVFTRPITLSIYPVVGISRKENETIFVLKPYFDYYMKRTFLMKWKADNHT